MVNQAIVMAAEFLAENWRGDDGAIVCRCCDATTFEAINEFALHLDHTGHLYEDEFPELREASNIWAMNLNPEWTKRGIWPHMG